MSSPNEAAVRHLLATFLLILMLSITGTLSNEALKEKEEEEGKNAWKKEN